MPETICSQTNVGSWISKNANVCGGEKPGHQKVTASQKLYTCCWKQRVARIKSSGLDLYQKTEQIKANFTM